MKVLLERQAGGYRASAPSLGESVEATTREAALNTLRDRIVARLVGNAEWVELDIPLPNSEPNPFAKLAGAFADDPTFDEFLAIIEENRRIENEAEGIYPERNPEPERHQ
jgi:hypothetical protein